MELGIGTQSREYVCLALLLSIPPSLLPSREYRERYFLQTHPQQSLNQREGKEVDGGKESVQIKERSCECLGKEVEYWEIRERREMKDLTGSWKWRVKKIGMPISYLWVRNRDAPIHWSNKKICSIRYQPDGAANLANKCYAMHRCSAGTHAVRSGASSLESCL